MKLRVHMQSGKSFLVLNVKDFRIGNPIDVDGLSVTRTPLTGYRKMLARWFPAKSHVPLHAVVVGRIEFIEVIK